MKHLYIILLVWALLNSCEKEKITSRSLTTEAFDQIELNDAFEVFLTEGNHCSIDIVGYETIIEYVDFKVDSQILKIENTRKLGWITPEKNKIKLYITSPPLQRIKADEGCNVQTLSPITSTEFGLVLVGKSNQANLALDCNTFYYWNNFPSGGKLTLSGTTNTLKIWNSAIMSVDAKNLTSKYAIVENSSKGDCEVTVLDRLEYSIKGIGNIHVYGDPKEIITIGISSSGRFIQH